MKKAAIFVCLLAGMAFAGGKTYSVTLYQPSTIGGTELKPGNYKVEVDGDKMLVRNEKGSTEAQVKVESVERKFDNTSVRYNNADGKYKVEEIHLGGTKTKLVLY